MISTNNPEINVEELMQRIRAEVAQRKAVSCNAENEAVAGTSQIPEGVRKPSGRELPGVAFSLPELAPMAVQPEFHPKPDGRYHINDLLCYHDEAFINAAYRSVLRRFPDTDGYLHFLNMLRSGCTKIDILGRLRYSQEGREAGTQISGLVVPFLLQQVYRIPVLGRFFQIFSAIWHLPHLERNQRTFENHVIILMEQAQKHFCESCKALNKSLAQQTKAALVALEEMRQVFTEAIASRAERQELTALTNHLEEMRQVFTKAIASRAERQELTALTNHLEEMRQVFTKAIASRAERQELTALTNHLVGLVQGRLGKEDLQPVEQNVGQLKELVENLQQTKAAQVALLDIKRNLLDQDRRLGLLLDEARKRLPEPISTEQIETMLTEDDHRLDAMYASFENHFRGTREDIKERVSIYLPMIQEVNAGSAEAPVLDLGCGRGEWLEVLRDNGLVATGVDINRIFLDGCRELGLGVVEKDAIAYLRSLKPNSVGAVTAFHLIEHLPIKTLIALMDETLRVLLPGGVVILETPNPANLITGSCNFYFDPTHRNPLPGPLTQYLLEARGFCRTQFMPLHPYGETPDRLTSGDPQVQRIVNQFLFGPQDYAVVAYKA